MDELTILDVVKSAGRALPANTALTHDGLGYKKLPGMSGRAASTGRLRLADLVPRAPRAIGGGAVGLPVVERPAGEQRSLQVSIAERSIVAQAGAAIVPISTEPATSDIAAVRSRAGEFRVSRPVTFHDADESNPLTAAALPVAVEAIEPESLLVRGAQIKLSRREIKDTERDALDAQLANSITAGLANLVDQVMLERLAADLTALPAGTALPGILQAVAPTGIRFEELRAIVGSAASGVTGVDEAGALRVAGIPAQMSGEHSDTIVGAFDRAAVAVLDDIRLTVARTSLDGAMEVTAWVDLAPLVPDPAFFAALSA
jgi:hypothetical protein